VWYEFDKKGNKRFTFKEQARTKDYIELVDNERGYIIRLGDGKAWLANTKDKNFNPYPGGKWKEGK
jgi:hypothetical protein